MKRGESLATGYFRGRSKRSPRLFEREDERKRKTYSQGPRLDGVGGGAVVWEMAGRERVREVVGP